MIFLIIISLKSDNVVASKDKDLFDCNNSLESNSGEPKAKLICIEAEIDKKYVQNSSNQYDEGSDVCLSGGMNSINEEGRVGEGEGRRGISERKILEDDGERIVSVGDDDIGDDVIDCDESSLDDNGDDVIHCKVVEEEDYVIFEQNETLAITDTDKIDLEIDKIRFFSLPSLLN